MTSCDYNTAYKCYTKIRQNEDDVYKETDTHTTKAERDGDEDHEIGMESSSDVLKEQ